MTLPFAYNRVDCPSSALAPAYRRGCSSAFSPLDLSPDVWYDPIDTTSLIKDMSNRVSQESDKSGNSHHAVQVTTNNQGVLNSTAIIGKPGIVYDGINDHSVRRQRRARS